MRAIGVGVVVAFATTTAALAQSPGDPAKGRQYAVMVCAACHMVIAQPIGASPSAPNQTGQAPSFEKIAATPGMTELALNVFFRSPHPSMPNLIVPAADVRDLIAYILSLKR